MNANLTCRLQEDQESAASLDSEEEEVQQLLNSKFENFNFFKVISWLC